MRAILVVRWLRTSAAPSLWPTQRERRVAVCKGGQKEGNCNPDELEVKEAEDSTNDATEPKKKKAKKAKAGTSTEPKENKKEEEGATVESFNSRGQR